MTSTGAPDTAAAADAGPSVVLLLVECPCGLACDPGECLSVPVLNLPVVPTAREACDRADEVAAWVRGRGPDDALVEPLLAAARSGGLSARGRVDALAAVEAARAMLDAVQLRLIAQIGEEDPDGKDWAREDIAAALRVSPRSAGNRLAIARALCLQFAATVKLVETGVVTMMHARKLVELTAHLDAEAADLVEGLVLPQAEEQTVGEFATAVRRAVARVDTATAAQRHDLARNERRVTIQPAADGMAELNWLLPAEQAMHITTRVNTATAHPHPGDPRTADQRRSDTLYQLITRDQSATGAAASADTGGVASVDAVTGEIRAARTSTDSVPESTAHGMRATVLVTVPVTVLSGDSDAPGELAGHGPIPAELARRIAADPTSTWRRLVTDPHGQLLDYGRSTYRPPADLTRHVIARDQTCCFPGCTRPAARCELDHCQDWAAGGPTNPDNLHALCPRHHHLKHEAGWRYADLPNGDIEWASPTGHRYIRQPRTYPDDHYFREPPRHRKPPPTSPSTMPERPALPDDPPPF